MTLDTSVSKAVFRGNGAAVDFPFSFRVWEESELVVQVTGADGAVRDVTTQCSVTLSEVGGTVHYAPGGLPLAEGNTLVILRNMPFLQNVKLITGTRFDPAVIEEALDRAAAERQQLLEKANRAIVVPADSADPPEELAEQLFAARDESVSAADRAAASEAEARTQADRAKSEADRAAQAAVLGTLAENLDAVWTLEADVPAGGTLELPLSYFAGRNMLHLSYDGVELYRGAHYEEIGEKDELSSAVSVFIPLPQGTVMHAWAVASNVARHVEEAETASLEAARKAQEEAARAEREADRAEAAAQAAELGAGAINLDATWTLACPVEPGGDIILPVIYWPGRAMLYLSADRKDLFRGSDYVEVEGEGPEGRSDRVKSMCRLAEGTVMHAWVIASNVSRLVDEAERRTAALEESARSSAQTAQTAAQRAEKAAGEAEISRNVAQNAAQEVTEQADRADEAAIDAGKYRNEAMNAAKCAAASVQARSLATLRSAELLEDAPSGFFVVEGELVLPGTIQHALTPVDGVDDIPNMDGFFLIVPPFTDCPPQPEEPDSGDTEKPDPEEPEGGDSGDGGSDGDSGSGNTGGNSGGEPDWMLPCGRRARIH